jgi:DNA-binding CsgD family transcriptional regulator
VFHSAAAGADVTHSSIDAGLAIAQQIVDREVWHMLVSRLKVSPREAHILDAILAFDEEERAIGTRLGISPHTVRTHTERLYRKLRVNSRCQLVARVFSEYVALAGAEARTESRRVDDVA